MDKPRRYDPQTMYLKDLSCEELAFNLRDVWVSQSSRELLQRESMARLMDWLAKEQQKSLG